MVSIMTISCPVVGISYMDSGELNMEIWQQDGLTHITEKIGLNRA